MVRRTRGVVRAGAVLASLLLVGIASADDSKLKVKIGDPFPDAAVAAAQVEKLPGKKAGDKVSIADLKGKIVVVAFYPKALTGG